MIISRFLLEISYSFLRKRYELYIVLVELDRIVQKLGIARSCHLLPAYGNRSSFGSCVYCLYLYILGTIND
jgi:hypothetical protein